MAPEMDAALQAGLEAFHAALQPYATGTDYLNFVERPVDVSTGYSRGSWHRLQRMRQALDPTGRILANHPVPHGEG